MTSIDYLKWKMASFTSSDQGSFRGHQMLSIHQISLQNDIFKVKQFDGAYLWSDYTYFFGKNTSWLPSTIWNGKWHPSLPAIKGLSEDIKCYRSIKLACKTISSRSSNSMARIYDPIIHIFLVKIRHDFHRLFEMENGILHFQRSRVFQRTSNAIDPSN